MLSRLLERGKTSGREDDNIESIKKRFRTLRLHKVSAAHILTFIGTYETDTMPVIEYYSAKRKVAKVCGTIFLSHSDLMLLTRSTVQDRWRLFTRQPV